ncbi:MAG: MFS transporter [Acetobacteraceae bacterium]|nr:MFS transporter [Acetobacteraceae bacterium]
MNRLAVAASAAGFCTFVNLYAPQSLLPTLATAFGASAAETGLTMTASLIAVALVAPVVGGISDAVGRRRLILPACFLLAAPTVLAGLAPGLPWFLAARFGQGLLLPFIFTVFVAFIADECPGAAALRLTGIYSVGAIVGGFSGRFIAGWTAYFLEWRASFLLLAAITLAGAFVMLLTMPPERNFRPVRSWRGTAAGFASQLRNGQVLVTCAAGFAVLFSIVATFTFANLLLAAPPYGLGPAELGSIFLTYLLGAVVTPAATRFAQRFGRRLTMLAAGLAAGAGLVLTLAPSLVLIIAGLSLVALGVLTEQMLSIGYVAVAGERARSTAVGLYVTSYYVGGSLGGIAPAWIWSHAGWPGCVGLVLAVQGAAVLLTWVAWPRGMALR